jgi:hypothetical protein
LPAPENHALEARLEGMIARGKKPDLVIDPHNLRLDRGLQQGPDRGRLAVVGTPTAKRLF